MYIVLLILLCHIINKAEVAFALVTKHGVKQDQIAALTPYSAQKEEIKKCLRNRGLSEIRVKTVTESQGTF